MELPTIGGDGLTLDKRAQFAKKRGPSNDVYVRSGF